MCKTQCIVWGHTQPADFQLQICHPPCYELAPLQHLNFEIVPCKEAWLVLFLKFSLNDAEGYVIQHEMCKCPSCCRVVDISWIFMWDVVISKVILNVVFSKLHIIVQWSVVYTCVVCYLNTCSVLLVHTVIRVKTWQYPDQSNGIPKLSFGYHTLNDLNPNNIQYYKVLILGEC